MSENLNINTVPSINDTVVEAINNIGYGLAGYESVATAVVEALQERENSIAEQIIESADNRYGYGTQAKEVVVDAGLYLKPEPVAVEEAPVAEDAPVAEEAPVAEDASVEARLARMESAINALVGLANTRFGANL